MDNGSLREIQMTKTFYLNRFGDKVEIKLLYASIMPRIAIGYEVLSNEPIQIHESLVIREEEEENETTR